MNRSIPTWAYEQGALVGLIVLAVALQARAPGTDAKAYALAVLGGAGVLVGQKLRSMADRQRERNDAAGVQNAPLECSAAMARWSVNAQGFALITAAISAPTWAHALIALYVAAYPTYRRLYRRRRPFRPASPGASTMKGASASSKAL